MEVCNKAGNFVEVGGVVTYECLAETVTLVFQFPVNVKRTGKRR